MSKESYYSEKITEINQLLSDKNYTLVLTECAKVFESIFKGMYDDILPDLTPQEKEKLLECEKKIGNETKGIKRFTFGELTRFFHDSDFFKIWSRKTGRDLGLINSLNFFEIVNVRNDSVHNGAKNDFSEALLIYSYLVNMLITLEYVDESEIGDKAFNRDQEELADIVLHKDRGVIVNKADGSRNISFRVDTINEIFDTFMKEIDNIKDKETATEILYKMGYNSGKRFGNQINLQWESGNSVLSYEEKIEKWCAFDSVVGWGLLQSDLTIDTDEGDVKGTFHIKENFMCYNRKKSQMKVCPYIKGYCSGVISELLDELDVRVECDGSCCPQDFPLKKEKECIFTVNVL